MMRAVLIASVALAGCTPALADHHVEAVSAAVPAAQLPPLYAAEVERARSFVDGMMAQGVVVPVPSDPGGGFTHEQHKRNYRAIYLAGQLYSVTGEAKYRDYVRDMLLAYAELYPTLGDHPAKANQNVGRLFWQVLNDAVWLVHSIQGYGDIRDTLTASERQHIDHQVFRRAAHFLSVESEATFDRIHNHATWATAGVGMTGYLLDDTDMVDRALLGSDKSGETGFLRQTELLFSPDGYYTEGPYYQRYALMPFMVFADSIAKNDPARRIFEHRDGILLKALQTTIQLTYGGYFFPFNDAIRDKSLNTDELYHGVAIAYAETRDPGLLAIADWQDRTILTEDGLALSRDLAGGKARAFPFRSLLLSDGPDGDRGAVAILRHGDGPNHTALVAKNASQGMGHGHFDKLSWQLYDNGNEIVRDYGAARFLNIVAKAGGRYLPENESWAKQTIAHNALVVDETSHFGGDRRLADTSVPTQLYFSDAQDLQVTSARIDSAYPEKSITMLRTLALLDVDGLDAPIIVDVLKASGEGDHRFDLPLHYSGHIMETGFEVARNLAGRPVLGTDDGYQHIWVDGAASPSGDTGFLTWILDGRFYTYRFVPQLGGEVILGESGANDPDFNLRREPLVIQRVDGHSSAHFVSLLESHGLYDGAAEQTVGSRSQIASLRHEVANGYDLVIVETKSGRRTALAMSYSDDPAQTHTAMIDGREVRWTGFAARIALD
ncbi:alginate lyase family protein [Qipengyuania vesicularis]|uniref:alginate lyase family protein n=1 Tax=Qipengyuania vesicularis TaxID=2867232 RepID=UPI001C880A62|nr:alginate lyase family protein [Qipengyuania vesicularis]MBX7527716.1 heparinase II/III family protein [Qipengyuania vesicularis]